jgi:hypothetical protein
LDRGGFDDSHYSLLGGRDGASQEQGHSDALSAAQDCERHEIWRSAEEENEGTSFDTGILRFDVDGRTVNYAIF